MVAVHSLSKRSNLAGVRVGFYAGDAELSSTWPRSASTPGSWCPGPVQAAAVVAWTTTTTSTAQRERYRRRLARLAEILRGAGLDADAAGRRLLPVGAGAGLGRRRRARPRAGPGRGCSPTRWPRRPGMLVSPGEFYGAQAAGFVRVAAVQPDDRIELVATRLAASDHPDLRASGADARRLQRGNGARPVTSGDGRPGVPDRRAVGPRGRAQPGRHRRPGVVTQAIDLLDRGEARVAEMDAATGEVVVHSWLKTAILLLFRLRAMETTEVGPFEYPDKLPLKTGYEAAGVRVVPGASARWGSFLDRGVILMPSYVNIGARVGADTMVDTWATVGSCAQIGARVHLSGGVGIGGVLEPPNAAPVMVGDDANIGSRCMVTQGARVGEGAVLAEGVILNPGIPVIDAETGEELGRGVVPPWSVAVGRVAPPASSRGRVLPALRARDQAARARASATTRRSSKRCCASTRSAPERWPTCARHDRPAGADGRARRHPVGQPPRGAPWPTGSRPTCAAPGTSR